MRSIEFVASSKVLIIAGSRSSALVVNIDRPWLYGELLNDFEIDVAQDAK